MYYGCIQEGDGDGDMGLCNNIAITDVNCLIGLTLLTICEPLSMLPYYLRSIRLYVIFRAQDYYFKNKKKPINWFKYIKERSLIKVCLGVTLVLAIITFGLYLGYQFGYNMDFFIYTPSYNV